MISDSALDSALMNKPVGQPPAEELSPDHWTMEVKADVGLLDIDLRELWRYRDLIGLIVRRDFVAAYKQTVLGPAWHLTEPLVTTLTYAFIFGSVAKISTDGLPRILFYLPGISLWTFFTNGLLSTAGTFNANAGVFGKVYFPRLVMPIASIISSLIAFAMQLSLFIVLLMVYMALDAPVQPTWYALLSPVLVLIAGGIAFGFGTLLSAVTTRYRDLHKLVQVSIRLLMFATPIIYPLSKVSGVNRTILQLNPMTAIVEAFRYGWLGTGSFSWGWLGYSCGVMVVVVVWGVLVFSKAEKVAMDSV
jgi:lipopolysaccharide transport system permease protein